MARRATAKMTRRETRPVTESMVTQGKVDLINGETGCLRAVSVVCVHNHHTEKSADHFDYVKIMPTTGKIGNVSLLYLKNSCMAC